MVAYSCEGGGGSRGGGLTLVEGDEIGCSPGGGGGVWFKKQRRMSRNDA
jgi:hypothetical protein